MCSGVIEDAFGYLMFSVRRTRQCFFFVTALDKLIVIPESITCLLCCRTRSSF